MSNFTTYGRNAMLDFVCADSPATITGTWLGVSTTTPTNAGTNITEPVGNNYARVQVTAGNWSAATGGTKTNSSVITFPTASGSWGALTHGVLFDAVSGGNALAWGALSPNQTIGASQTLEIAVGDLDLAITD